MTPRIIRDLLTVVVVLALLSLSYVLPSDTSLRNVLRSGVLRACVPTAYPPLVTGNPKRPGVDVEILQNIADDLGVRLRLVRNAEVGSTFNPRAWRITRAQCEIIAGGVIVTDLTRSFLETTTPHLETGWAILSPDPAEGADLASSSVGFVPGAPGLDRIALSSYLRNQDAVVTLYGDSLDALHAIRSGAEDLVVTEALKARQLARDRDLSAAYLPAPLKRYPIALGLWKGDVTLKRATSRTLRRLHREGLLDAILDDYDLGAIINVCTICDAAGPP